MVSRKFLLLPVLLAFLSPACNATPTGPAESIPAITATSSPSPTIQPAPSDTTPPPAQATPVPVEGTTATQLNVRSEPSTAGSVLGILPPGTIVSIVAKDPGGNWLQILYPQAAEGKGWVTVQYVTVADTAAIPVIGGGAGTDTNSGNVAVVQQQINVRSGPGTGFNSLGTLNAQDVVSLTGKDANSTWLQISYTPGPDGKGWVNAAFVQAQGVENLPIITEAGQVVGTGTPTTIPASPTATLVPAPQDQDSAGNPIVSVVFAPAGTHTLIYNGDVSAPAGDLEDWLRFVPFSKQVILEISCSGSSLLFGITPNAPNSPTSGDCNSRQIISVEPGQAVVIHAQASGGAGQTYTSYTIKVESIP